MLETRCKQLSCLYVQRHNSFWVTINVGYQGKVDVMVGYDPDNDKLYVFSSKEFSSLKREITLRLTPSENNQVTGIRSAVDYELTSPHQLLS